MLLPEKPHTIQYLPRSGARRLEASLEICVLSLESLDPLRRRARRAGRSFQRLYSCFCLKRSTAECRKLVTEMTDKLLKLVKCLQIRTIAV